MNIKNLILLAFILLGMLFYSTTRAEGDIVRDIILINGVAELVDLTPTGDIVERHVVIQDYFSSGRSHDKSLRQGLDKLKIFGNLEMETESPFVYDTPVACRQSLMVRDSYQTIEEISKHLFDSEVNSYNELGSENSISESLAELSFGNFSLTDNMLKRQRLRLSLRWYGTEQVLTTSYKTSKASNDV